MNKSVNTGLISAIPFMLILASSQVFGHETEDETVIADTVETTQHRWGTAAVAGRTNRVIDLSMTDDMRFSPAHVPVHVGETVTFRLKNEGQVLHEFVLGTDDTLAEHAALMAKFPGMAHSEAYMVHVPPGETGTLHWTFNKPGDFDFACLIAGHFQAGMVGTIAVK